MKKSENKILVTRSSMPDYEEYCNEIKELWESRWLTNNGIKHNKLSERLSQYLNVDYVSLYCNGHLALENIISAMELSGEVITTPFTFASTTNAIIRCGLTPIFCDIKKDDYTIDPTKIEELITPSTSAIIAVHVYGNLCDDESITRIAKKYNLKVIYDAAHAFGIKNKINCKSVASMGDASMFSFHSTKVFHTIEGGAVCYNDNSLTPILNSYKNFGINGIEDFMYVGGNAKMNEFQASMGLCNLRHVDEEIAKRKAIYERYIQNLQNVEGIILNKPKDGVKSNYAYFPVIFDGANFNRDEIWSILNEYNICSRKYFYPATNEFKYFENGQVKKARVCETPIANYVSNNILCLPMYADLNIKEVDNICEIILDAISKE